MAPYSSLAMHWRTHVVDVCTESELTGEALYELADTGLSATKAAMENSHNLLNWDEYKQL